MESTDNQASIIESDVKPDRLCFDCSQQEWHSMFVDTKKGQWNDGWTIKDFWTTALRCPFCHLCFRLLERTPRFSAICRRRDEEYHLRVSSENHWVLDPERSGKLEDHVIKRLNIELLSEARSDHRSFELDEPTIQLLASNEDVDDMEKLHLGRWVRGPQANTQIVQRWLDECDSHHSLKCKVPKIFTTRRNLRLVDVVFGEHFD